MFIYLQPIFPQSIDSFNHTAPLASWLSVLDSRLSPIDSVHCAKYQSQCARSDGANQPCRDFDRRLRRQVDFCPGLCRRRALGRLTSSRSRHSSYKTTSYLTHLKSPSRSRRLLGSTDSDLLLFICLLFEPILRLRTSIHILKLEKECYVEDALTTWPGIVAGTTANSLQSRFVRQHFLSDRPLIRISPSCTEPRVGEGASFAVESASFPKSSVRKHRTGPDSTLFRLWSCGFGAVDAPESSSVGANDRVNRRCGHHRNVEDASLCIKQPKRIRAVFELARDPKQTT